MDRFPSRSEAVLIFGIASFPIFAWANLQLLREVPSWLLRLRPAEMIWGAAYIEAFALFESFLLYAGLIVFMMLLPSSWIRGRAVSLAFVLTIVVSLAGIAIHYTAQTLRQWGWAGVAGVSLTILSVAVLGQYFALSSERLREVIHEIVDRVVLLAYLYTTVGIVGLFLVLARNL